MKIAIGIGVNENIRTKTFSTILSILKKNPKIDVLIEQSCLIHKNRERLAERAIEGNYDYLFFVDGDMCFAPEVLDRLLSRNKDIVGANYYRRNIHKETVTKAKTWEKMYTFASKLKTQGTRFIVTQR